jgi:hypothetical protein
MQEAQKWPSERKSNTAILIARSGLPLPYQMLPLIRSILFDDSPIICTTLCDEGGY